MISSSLKSSDVAVGRTFSLWSAPKAYRCSWLCTSDGVMWAPLRRNSANLRVRRETRIDPWLIDQHFLTNQDTGGQTALWCVKIAYLCGERSLSTVSHAGKPGLVQYLLSSSREALVCLSACSRYSSSVSNLELEDLLLWNRPRNVDSSQHVCLGGERGEDDKRRIKMRSH